MIVAKQVLREWILEALQARGGSATLVEVCRHVWQYHEDDLWDSGDLFYTWQYDVRWAATELRRRGLLRAEDKSPRGVWELADGPALPREEIRVKEPIARSEVRSPPWSRDELILALDLYHRRGNLNARHREVIVLSDTLRRLPINPGRPANYRSPASVNRKLGNFAALDPGFPGAGLAAAGTLDRVVFDELFDAPDRLRAEVERILATVAKG